MSIRSSATHASTSQMGLMTSATGESWRVSIETNKTIAFEEGKISQAPESYLQNPDSDSILPSKLKVLKFSRNAEPAICPFRKNSSLTQKLGKSHARKNLKIFEKLLDAWNFICQSRTLPDTRLE